MTYIPEQGDIVWLDFDPSSGKEMMKHRPAFVISKRIFNQHAEFAIVAPITSTIRDIKLEVILPKTLETQGVVLVHQLKSLDYMQRKVKKVESAPKEIIERVSAIAKILVQ